MKTQTKTFASFKTWKTASGYGQWLLNSTTCAFERIPYDIFLQVILKEMMDEEHLPQQPLQRRSSRPTQSRRPGWWCWEWTWPSLTSWSGYTDTTETHQQHIINEVSSSLENILVLFFCEGVLSENMRKTCCINGTETRPPPNNTSASWPEMNETCTNAPLVFWCSMRHLTQPEKLALLFSSSHNKSSHSQKVQTSSLAAVQILCGTRELSVWGCMK